MTEETSMPAEAPAGTEVTTMPAEQTPAETYYEQPAETPEPENYDEHFQDGPAQGPADLGEILEDRPKKLSGAQRAKLQRQYLENELREREQRIEALERHIHDENDRRRSDESERHAETQRKRDEAHLERLKEAKGTITDFDRVMAKMAGAPIHEDLLDDVLGSEKSHLLAYHLANHPAKLVELNHMSDRERVREIGRLEGSLKMPAGKKQTTAPPPPSMLRGGAAPATDLATADMTAYVAARKRQGFK